MRLAVPDLVSNSYFPAIAAVELGLFRTQDWMSNWKMIFPIGKAMEALRDGQIDFVAGPAHATLSAFPAWQGAKLLAALSQHTFWGAGASIQPGCRSRRRFGPQGAAHRSGPRPGRRAAPSAFRCWRRPGTGCVDSPGSRQWRDRSVIRSLCGQGPGGWSNRRFLGQRHGSGGGRTQRRRHGGAGPTAGHRPGCGQGLHIRCAGGHRPADRRDSGHC